MKCRHCQTELTHVFADLVNSPPSNAMLTEESLNQPETFYPLKIYVCDNCNLVQVDELKKANEIFCDGYVYYSSFSSSFLRHAKDYVDLMMKQFSFNKDSQIIEIASNDGYLLQYFKEYGVRVLGIEPAVNTANVAREKGIDTITEFFGSAFAIKEIAGKNRKADLLIGNNVLAHVPDINDFVEGMKIALKDEGIVTMEFPHLVKLIAESQFDTIYHEHFSYLSFATVQLIFASKGLELFDVEEISTHGGSLRIYAKHDYNKKLRVRKSVKELLEKEKEIGINSPEFYDGFQKKVEKVKYDFLKFILAAKAEGKKIIGYGAAAKGNTFLNYCGIKGNDLISVVVDASPYKQNKYLPGSHIRVVGPEEISQIKPDYVIILPWNFKNEIRQQHSYINHWGGKFVTYMPSLEIFS